MERQETWNMKKVFFAPNKRHLQVFSDTFLPRLGGNIYLLVRDVVNQMRPVLVRSSLQNVLTISIT